MDDERNSGAGSLPGEGGIPTKPADGDTTPAIKEDINVVDRKPNSSLDIGDDVLSEKVGSDIFMKTSHNGKEMRKAYETTKWKSDYEINYLEPVQFSIKTPETLTRVIRLSPGREFIFTTDPSYIKIGWYSSDINVAHVSIYNNVKKIVASKPGTAIITIYDSNNTDCKVNIHIKVPGD